MLFRVPGGLRENYAVATRLRSRGVMVSARGPLGSGDKGLCALPKQGGRRGAGGGAEGAKGLNLAVKGSIRPDPKGATHGPASRNS